MNLLDRLRGWWRSTFGGDDLEDAGGAGTYDYECTVCGTGVDGPDADCPLCRSSDVVATDRGTTSALSRRSKRVPPSAAGTGDSGRGDRGGPVGRAPGSARAADLESRPVRRYVAAADDESVERLRELRDGGELLERHADRWEPHPGGFRVETPTGTRIVDSREEVVALLRAADR